MMYVVPRATEANTSKLDLDGNVKKFTCEKIHPRWNLQKKKGPSMEYPHSRAESTTTKSV
jgi:hypothetical protein